MPSPNVLTDAQRKSLWTEVQAEFPDDVMMQEIHFARLLNAAETKDLTPAERVAQVNRLLPRTAAAD